MMDLRVLVKRVLTYVDRERKISKMLSCLPWLDCKKCGFASCEEMAVAIYEGKAKPKDCVVLRLKSKMKTEVTVKDVEVHIQSFVSDIIRKSVLGIISSLKGISIKGNERV